MLTLDLELQLWQNYVNAKCKCSNHSHVTYYTTSYYLLAAAEKASYELLCKDNTRAPIDSYKTCHLSRVPAHAVVSRKNPELANRIYSKLMAVEVLDITVTCHPCHLSTDLGSVEPYRAL